MERSIQQAKLERQAQTAEEKDLARSDEEGKTTPPNTPDERKFLETDIDKSTFKASKVDLARKSEEDPSTSTTNTYTEFDKDIAFADAALEVLQPSQADEDSTRRTPDTEKPTPTTSAARYRSRKPPQLKLPSSDNDPTTK